MRKHDLISSLIWFLGGMAIVLCAPGYDLGTAAAPGPGFMPFLAGVVMIAFSLITFFQTYFNPAGEIEKIWAHIEFPKLLFVLAILFLYILFLQPLGFLVSTFLMILILVRFVGALTWLASLLGAGLTSLLSYVLLDTWLKAQLPRGFLGF